LQDCTSGVRKVHAQQKQGPMSLALGLCDYLTPRPPQPVLAITDAALSVTRTLDLRNHDLVVTLAWYLRAPDCRYIQCASHVMHASRLHAAHNTQPTEQSVPAKYCCSRFRPSCIIQEAREAAHSVSVCSKVLDCRLYDFSVDRRARWQTRYRRVWARSRKREAAGSHAAAHK
jgi:hypothetical protein